ncbi:hypothetical protein LMG27952_03257 [Paraburkholderia hiiakae]|uniref:Uncharacterized protein n=1 Tax=Paraburkholderia hiiakae TaxID=1081782 RepID=A0ABM8NPX8_9BURK|nr:hypothetical protein [Paraburkholderia hiiakae]CAD6537361.1 hypothetical protein LMG27952_03257 [Paraburkholderia hiiakae]
MEKTMDPLQANILKSVRQMKAGAVRVTRGKPTAAALARATAGLSQSA